MKYKFPFLLLCLAILLASCSEPEPLTQESLDAINCQPGDLPKGQTYNAVESRFIEGNEIFLGQDPILVSNRTWNDISSTRQTFSCTIYVFESVEFAQDGYQTTCGSLRPPFKFPDYGDLSCLSGDQEVSLIFQRENILVWIWADYKGQGIEDVAKVLNDRLRNR